MSNSCLSKWLDYKKRRLKKVLEEHLLIDKLYPHSLLVFTLDLSTIFNEEIAKFTRSWCSSETSEKIIKEIEAIKEIFTTENEDTMTWNIELLANKYMNERVDSLIEGYMYFLRLRTQDP